MTSQALLAELSDPDRDAAAIAARALRLCYTGDGPGGAAAAAVLGPRWFGPAIVAGQLLYLPSR